MHAIIDGSIGKIVCCNQYQEIDYGDDDWVIKSTDAALQAPTPIFHQFFGGELPVPAEKLSQ